MGSFGLCEPSTPPKVGLWPDDVKAQKKAEKKRRKRARKKAQRAAHAKERQAETSGIVRPLARDEVGTPPGGMYAGLFTAGKGVSAGKKAAPKPAPNSPLNLPFGWMGVDSRSRPGKTVYKNIFTGEKVSWVPQSPASKEVGKSPDVSANLSPKAKPSAHQSLPTGPAPHAMRPLNDLVQTPSPAHKGGPSGESTGAP